MASLMKAITKDGSLNVSKPRSVLVRRGLQEEGRQDGGTLPPKRDDDDLTLKQPAALSPPECQQSKTQMFEDTNTGSALSPTGDANKDMLQSRIQSDLSESKSIKTHESTATSGIPAMSSARRPDVSSHSPRVGAQAIPGPGLSDDVEIGDGGTVVIGGTVVAEPVVHDDLEGEIRQELQSEMRRGLQSAEAVSSDSELGSRSKSGRSLCTRRRLYILAIIAAIALIGILVGVLTNRKPADPNTIYGLNPGDRFADFMVMSGDSSTLAIGSDKESYAMVFRRSGRDWNQLGQTLFGDGQFGRTLDLSRDGNMLVVGSWSNDDAAEKAGKANVFRFNGSMWDPVGQELFGDMTRDRYVSSHLANCVKVKLCGFLNPYLTHLHLLRDMLFPCQKMDSELL